MTRLPGSVRAFVCCLGCLAALAVPSAALAQGGAGDDQYTDPFASGQVPTPTATPRAPSPAPAAPSPAPAAAAPSPAAAAPATTPAPATAAPAPPTRVATRARAQAAAAPQLPRTGADGWLALAAGGLLVGAGVALRVRVR